MNIKDTNILNHVFINNSINKKFVAIENLMPPKYIRTVIELADSQQRVCNIMKNMLPANYLNNIINEICFLSVDLNNMISSISSNYFLKSIENISEATFAAISNNSILYNMTNIISQISDNVCYIDTINSCINELLKSNINLNNMFVKKDLSFDFINDIEQIEEVDEDDKKEIIKSMQEVIDTVENQNCNFEQQIYAKINKLKEKHPLVASILRQIWVLFIPVLLNVIFTNKSSNYYIQNYTEENNNIKIEINIESKKQDFIENARYVIANKLNVRKEPKKEKDIIAILNYGDVVKVINKVNYWTEIEFVNKSDNTKKQRGWAYSRYLEKFNKELLSE